MTLILYTRIAIYTTLASICVRRKTTINQDKRVLLVIAEDISPEEERNQSGNTHLSAMCKAELIAMLLSP
jgi:hypothetical protein